MKYNSIFFSYQSLLQINILTCMSGSFPPGPRSGLDEEKFNVLIKICQEYFHYNYQYNDVHGAPYTRDIVLVLMQGVQPFNHPLL